MSVPVLPASNFSRALDFVLDHEGRVCERVDGDPGGKTKWGITQNDYDTYRTRIGETDADVFDATEAEITAIYHLQYWLPLLCDSLPYSVALTVFDTGVNVGTGRCRTWLRAILGIGQFDMWISAAHLYIEKHGSEGLANAVIHRRNAYYRQIGAPGMPLHKFLDGWLNRTADLAKEVAAA